MADENVAAPPPVPQPTILRPRPDDPLPVGAWPRQPDVDGDTLFFRRFTFAGCEHLPGFDLKNGDPSDVKPLLFRATTIQPAYHWVPIAGIAPEDSVAAVDAHVASQLHQMATNPDPALTETQRRKAAIVIGVSRAVMTKHYRLAAGDFIGGELAPSVIKAWRTDDEGIACTVTAPLNDPHRDILMNPIAYTEDEKAVIAVMLGAALGTLPLQGYSLVMTGHHYISDPASPSRKAFALVEKQFWKSAAVRDYFAADVQVLQDACWHKAGHPVSATLKQEFASSEKTAEMLREAGVGSAACRLPAMEPQLRAASSYLALMDAVNPFFEMVGGRADAGLLAGIIKELKGWKRGATTHAIPEDWPPTIKNRNDAMIWLGYILQRNAPKAAYCFGFYCALAEQTRAMGGAAGGDALRMSFSLSKLRMNCHASYLEGTLAYGAFAAARNGREMAGEDTALPME